MHPLHCRRISNAATRTNGAVRHPNLKCKMETNHRQQGGNPKEKYTLSATSFSLRRASLESSFGSTKALTPCQIGPHQRSEIHMQGNFNKTKDTYIYIGGCRPSSSHAFAAPHTHIYMYVYIHTHTHSLTRSLKSTYTRSKRYKCTDGQRQSHSLVGIHMVIERHAT